MSPSARPLVIWTADSERIPVSTVRGCATPSSKTKTFLPPSSGMTAIDGTVSASEIERRTRSTLAKTPGMSAPSLLGQRARTRSDRVVTSTLGSMA